MTRKMGWSSSKDFVSRQGVFSKWAVSWQNWCIIAPLGVSGMITISLAEEVDPWSTIIRIAILSEASAGLVIGIAYLLGAPQAGPTTKLMTWCLSAGVRSGVLWWQLQASSPAVQDGSVEAIRAVIAFAIAAVLLQAVVTLMLYHYENWRTRRIALESSVRRRLQINADSRARIANQRDDITRAYTTIVIPRIDALMAEIRDSHQSRPALTSLARKCGIDAREHVRQLSHDFASPPSSAPPVDLPRDTRVSVGLWQAVGNVTPPPLLTAILAVAIRLPVEATWGGDGPILRGLFAGLWVWIFFACVDWVNRRIRKSRPEVHLLLPASLLIFGVFSYYLLHVSYMLFPSRVFVSPAATKGDWFSRETAGAIWLVGCAILATLIAAAKCSADETNQQLEAIDLELKQAQALLDSRIRQLRWQAARVLHGSVQGRLAIAGVMLRESAQLSDPLLRKQSVRKIQKLLNAAKQDLADSRSTTPPHLSLTGSIADLVDRWQGLLDVQWSVGDGVTELCRCNSEIVTEVTEILAEALSNSSRHGQASAASVTIELQGTCLSLVVCDDGLGLGAPSDELVPGLGYTGVTQFGGSYKLFDIDPHGARLEVCLDTALFTDSETAVNQTGSTTH